MAEKKRDAVGVVGLGIMGGAFAENLVAAGRRVIGYDIDASRRRALAEQGVEIAKNAGDVARQAPVIILSLPKPAALAETVAAIAKAKVPRRVVIEASTFKLEDKIAAAATLRKAGHVLLDCPVSGTGLQAKVKDLVIYASGPSSEIKKLRPLFADFTRAVQDLGDFGNGSRMKYIANLLVAIHNVASAEALVLGMKAGLPPDVVYDAGQDRRRQFTRLRIARADDGGRPLRPADYESLDLAERYGRHRQFRARAWRADAVVLGDVADLRRRHVDRLRHAGYRLDLRGAGSNGWDQARHGEESEARSGGKDNVQDGAKADCRAADLAARHLGAPARLVSRSPPPSLLSSSCARARSISCRRCRRSPVR